MLEFQFAGLAEHADDIAGSFEEEGLPVPDDVRPPRVLPFYVFYWKAYKDLATERQQRGFPIPITKQLEYARAMGVRRLDEFLDILAAVDGWLLARLKGTEEDGRPSDTGNSGPDEHPAAGSRNPWLDAGSSERDAASRP